MISLYALGKFSKKISLLFLRFFAAEFWCSNISAMTEHMRNQIFLMSYPKKVFFKIFTFVLLDGFLDIFLKFWLFIVKICILIRYFRVFFENYSMLMLSICGNDFIAHWAYIRGTNFRVCSASGKMWTVFTCTIHAEHTRSEFYRTLSIRGTREGGGGCILFGGNWSTSAQW